jgi:hypothetical protein
VAERDGTRQVAHRLSIIRHVEEVSGNVAQTCRYYGISRPTFYKWLRRYEEIGAAGLADRSRRPHHSPNATPHRGRRQGHPPPPDLPLRPTQDRYVPQALSRRRRQPVRGVADSQAARHEPAAELAALQAPQTNAGSDTRRNKQATASRSM